MNLLLDTHVLIWWLTNDRTLLAPAHSAIANPASVVYVSAVSVWELAIKQELGKISAPSDLLEQLDRHGFQHLHITLSHALVAGGLPRHHRDAFDRMLVAQALTEGLTIVTRDSRLSLYEAPTVEA